MDGCLSGRRAAQAATWRRAVPAILHPVGHAQPRHGRIVAVLAVLGSLVGATPSQALVVGIADQQVASFTDPRLTALPVRHARLSVAWDALDYGWQRRELDEWMRATTRRRRCASS